MVPRSRGSIPRMPPRLPLWEPHRDHRRKVRKLKKTFTYDGNVYTISDTDGPYIDIIDELTEQFVGNHTPKPHWDDLYEDANEFAEKFASRFG